MTSGLKRDRARSPMPIYSTFDAPNMNKTYCEPTSYVLSPEELAEVIRKYGAPTAPLSSRRRPMHEQRPKPKRKKETE